MNALYINKMPKRAAGKAAAVAGMVLAVIAVVFFGGTYTAKAAVDFEWTQITPDNLIKDNLSNIDKLSVFSKPSSSLISPPKWNVSRSPW